MSRSIAPPRTSPAPEDLLIDIDPSLIEEALAAVDRRLGHGEDDGLVEDEPASLGLGAEASERNIAAEDGLEVDVEVDLDIGVAEPPPRAPSDRRRLLVRVDEQAVLIRRLERELAHAVEGRDLADRQLRDARKAHGEISSDFERYRVRSRKDVEEAERRGEDKILRPVIEVYDNVERAWLHAVSDPAQILGGLQMIVEQFKRLLTRVGFERIEADRGMLFDPSVHEAVMHVRTDEVLPGTIVDEVHAGFRLRGRLFRPARVTVSAPDPSSK